jgi:hypothetical protein
MLREVRIPDVAPAERPIRPGCLSMCAGDFVEVYSKPDQVIFAFFPHSRRRKWETRATSTSQAHRMHIHDDGCLLDVGLGLHASTLLGLAVSRLLLIRGWGALVPAGGLVGRRDDPVLH